MRVTTVSLIGTVLGVPAAGEECPIYSQRLMFLQDTNKDMGKFIKQLYSRFYWIAGELEKVTLYTGIGLTEFSDKGIPFTGWGQHLKAFKNQGDPDVCYKQLIAIYRTRPELYDILGDLKPRLGGDPEGSHLEAVLYASQNKNSRFYHDQDWHWDALVVRDMVLFTDGIPHEAGDAAELVAAYNGPPWTDIGALQPARPVGWGSQKMYKMDAATVWVNGTHPYTTSNYDDLAFLEWKIVHGGLDASEKKRHSNLVDIFGARKFSDPIKAHDGKATNTDKPELDCKKKDYPTWKQVAKELNAFRTGLTVIVHETTPRASNRLIEYCPEYPSYYLVGFKNASDKAKCVKKYWEDHLSALGLPHYKVYLEKDGEYANMILESLQQHQAVECKWLNGKAKH